MEVLRGEHSKVVYLGFCKKCSENMYTTAKKYKIVHS